MRRNLRNTLALAAMMLAVAPPAVADRRARSTSFRSRYIPPGNTALQREIAEHNARVEQAKHDKRLAKLRRTQEGEKP